MGRVGDHIAVQVVKNLRRSKTTMAIFDVASSTPVQPNAEPQRAPGTGTIMGLLVELLVSVLLAVTIGYCVSLNRQIKRLKMDEESFRKVVTDLRAASEKAKKQRFPASSSPRRKLKGDLVRR